MNTTGGVEDQATEPTSRAEPAEAGAPRRLAPWILLWLVTQSVLWGLGVPQARLSRGVEEGAAEVERRSVGEIGEEQVRESIATQRDTLRFFAALAWAGDFLMGPLGLAIRALAAAAIFASIAAATGRPVGFAEGLDRTADAQGFWVIGLVVSAVLTVLLRRPEVETSATLLLPSGTQPATLWLMLRQVEPFALAGWFALARGAWRRGQTSVAGATLAVLVLWGLEAAIRISTALTLGAWTRLTLIPESL